jgi:hypothetical protein
MQPGTKSAQTNNILITFRFRMAWITDTLYITFLAATLHNMQEGPKYSEGQKLIGHIGFWTALMMLIYRVKT